MNTDENGFQVVHPLGEASAMPKRGRERSPLRAEAPQHQAVGNCPRSPDYLTKGGYFPKNLRINLLNFGCERRVRRAALKARAVQTLREDRTPSHRAKRMAADDLSPLGNGGSWSAFRWLRFGWFGSARG